MYLSPEKIVKAIEEFKERMKTEAEFCQELYQDATLKVMSA